MFDSTGTTGALVNSTSFDRYWTYYTAFETALAADRKNASLVKDSSTLQEVVDRFVARRGLKDKELQGFNTWLSSVVEQEYATNSKYLSAKNFDSDLGYSGKERVLTNGYKSLIDKLIRPGTAASVIAVNITYNANVTNINYAANAANLVTVTTASGAKFRGKHVIVTLPLGVLKATHTTMFTPALPTTHQTAIKQLGVAVMNKVTLVYPSAWWSSGNSSANRAWLHNLGANHSRWSEFYNMAATGQTPTRPILVGFNIGDYAVQMESLNDTQATNEAHAMIKRMLPKAQADAALAPSASYVTRWASDPWSRGSYSFLPPGASWASYDAFVAPVRLGALSTGLRVLRFAGEHTNWKDPSTVHGALASGRREAAAILTTLAVRHRRMRA